MAVPEQTFHCLVHDFGCSSPSIFFHPIFTCPSHLYIITFSLLERLQLSQLSDWIMQLHHLAFDPPILIVGTHLESFAGKLSAISDEIRERFPPSQYPNIVDIVYCSCPTGDGVDALKEKIIKTLQKRACAMTVHPLLSNFIEEIVNLRKTNLSVFGQSVLNEIAYRFTESTSNSERSFISPDGPTFYGALLQSFEPAKPFLPEPGRHLLRSSTPPVLSFSTSTFNSTDQSATQFLLTALGIIIHHPDAMKGSHQTLLFNTLWLSQLVNQLIGASSDSSHPGILHIEHLATVFNVPKLSLPKKLRLMDILERLGVVYPVPRNASSTQHAPADADDHLPFLASEVFTRPTSEQRAWILPPLLVGDPPTQRVAFFS